MMYRSHRTLIALVIFVAFVGSLIAVPAVPVAALPIEAEPELAHPFFVHDLPGYAGSTCYSSQPESSNVAPSCNNNISSIQLEVGWSARVYDGANLTGASVCINRSHGNLVDHTYDNGAALNNTISSFQLFNQPYCGTSGVPAFPLEVFTDFNYVGGYCYSAWGETANINGSCNNLISSILLRSGWFLRVYEGSNQTGATACLAGSDPNLSDNYYDGTQTSLNDTISSFVLSTNNLCQGPPANIPPNAPILQSPANGVTLGSRSMTLSWQDGGDPDNGPRASRDFYASIRKPDNSWSANSGWQFGTSWNVTVPADGTYVWNVQAGDGAVGTWAGERTVVVQSPDTVAPDGTITSPSEGTQIGASVTVNANAWDNNGGRGVDRVEFFAAYDGRWHAFATDTSAPYQAIWNVPAGLRSQTIILTIHVIDKAGNRRMDPGGYRRVNYTASAVNPSVKENWISSDRLAYLNQLAVTPNGNVKCSAASMAMALAMNRYIRNDIQTMINKANEMYPRVLSNGTAYIYLQVNELKRQGASGSFYKNHADKNAQWNFIKEQINAGIPVVAGANTTNAGHLILVIGWREVNGVRKIIVNDPYGRWTGSGFTYDVNSGALTSAKGRWVEYDVNINGKWTLGEWTYTTGPVRSTAPATITEVDTPTTPPGETSLDEPETLMDVEGVPIGTTTPVYLPLVHRP